MGELPGPLFSIATVCLNAEANLAETIESVLSQSFEDFEYVVVDGGSTDGSLDVIREHASRSGGRMRWISEADDGLYHAMNKALDLAQGKFIEYLGADDLLAPGALQAVSEAVERQPRPQIVCGATHVFGRRDAWDEPARRVVRRGMAQRAPSRHQSIFVCSESIRGAGGFRTRFRIAADYDLYLRLLEAGASETLVDDTLSSFRLGGLSSTGAIRTARDYRDVRIAHGANPIVEQLVMLKSAAATTAFAIWRQLTSRSREVER